jgi:O-antigen/teichoic acid export membrane protein
VTGEARADRAGALLLGRVLAILGESLVLLLVVRLLGKADVGALASMLLAVQTIALVATAGFPSALVYFLPGRGLAERRAIARLHFALLGALGCACAPVLVAFACADETEVALAWILLVPYVALDLPTRALPNLLVIEGRVRACAVLGIVRSLGTSAATLVPLALGTGVVGVAVALDVFAAVYAVAIPWTLRAVYRRCDRVGSPVSMRSVVRVAVPLGLTDIVGAIGQRLDKWLVLVFLSVEALAEYQVGAWQIPVLVAIPYVVGTALAPELRELFAAGRGREALAIWRASVRKVALVVVPCGMVFVVAAEDVMVLLFTHDYAAAAGVFRCYALLTMARVAAFGVVLVAAGRPRWALVAACISLASAVALQVPLALAFGFLGPALGSALAFVPMAAAYCWFIGRATGVPATRVFPIADWLRTAALAGIAGLLALAVDTQLRCGPALSIAVDAMIVLGSFGALAVVTGDLGRAELRVVSRWLRPGRHA